MGRVETGAGHAAELGLEREWWLRTLAVFTSPVSTFAALRDASRARADAREEPVLALVLLAGVASVLATPTVGDLLDSRERGAASVAVIVFLAGALYGVATYWIGGGFLRLGLRAAGSAGTYRQARHLLAYAAAPLALALLVVWPLRLAVYGGDVFREGGADEGGAARAFDAAELGFFAWAAFLLVLGVKVVHDWPLVRSLGALALAALALLVFSLAFLIVGGR
jgi:hypothetical protein